MILACRNRGRADAACRDIVESTGNPDVEVRILDLGSFKSIRQFADDINNSE